MGLLHDAADADESYADDGERDDSNSAEDELGDHGKPPYLNFSATVHAPS